MKNEIRVDSWATFEEAIEEYVRVPPWTGSFAFRGQANANWALEPSILRMAGSLGPGENSIHALEREATGYFMARASNYTVKLPDASDDLPEWWALMQHYGVPTRLLDWTRSAYVAAYFAVKEFQNSEDGALYFVHFLGVIEAVRTVESSLGHLNDVDFKSMVWKADIDPQPWIWFTTPNRMTDRMMAQQGMYSISISPKRDHWEEIQKVVPSDMRKYVGRIIIPSSLKREFASRLHHMNINATSLFPGIDGLGRGIKELVSLQVENEARLGSLLTSDPLLFDRAVLPLLRYWGDDLSALESIDVRTVIDTSMTWNESLEKTLSMLGEVLEEEE